MKAGHFRGMPIKIAIPKSLGRCITYKGKTTCWMSVKAKQFHRGSAKICYRTVIVTLGLSVWRSYDKTKDTLYGCPFYSAKKGGGSRIDAIAEIFGDKSFGSNDVPTTNVDVERAATDLEYFAKTYFPHIFTIEMCVFHEDMFHDSQQMIFMSRKKKQQQFFVRAAPRGFGKSRIISIVLPLWCICYGYRKNILLLADTSPQSKEYVGTIKNELEKNDKLRKDFGDLVGTEKWAEDEIVTANDIHIVAKSTGKSLRGTSYNNMRPDLVVMDDMENDEMIETENQRNKLKKWFSKVLIPIGMPWTCFLYVGSILHYDSLLYMVLCNKKYSNWNRKIYKSIYQFSQSPLWGQWEELFTDLSDPNASETAYGFYMQNRKEMLEGTVLLWEKWHTDEDGLSRSYYDLQIIKLQDDESFNSEYQNTPQTEESRIFKEAWLNANTYESLPKMKEIYGAVDLSMGKSRTSDTSAIIFVGRGEDNFLYVLDADICRRSPDKISSDIIEYIIKYEAALTGFIVETNVFQEFFATTLKDTCVKMGLYVNWIERKSVAGDSKVLRIKSLSPKVKLGYIKFNPEHRVLNAQLKDFPKGHDDGPDALEMCVNQFVQSTHGVLITSLKNKFKPKKITTESLLKGWFT